MTGQIPEVWSTEGKIVRLGLICHPIQEMGVAPRTGLPDPVR